MGEKINGGVKQTKTKPETEAEGRFTVERIGVLKTEKEQ